MDGLDSNALNSPNAEEFDNYIDDFKANNPNFDKLVNLVNNKQTCKGAAKNKNLGGLYANSGVKNKGGLGATRYRKS